MARLFVDSEDLRGARLTVTGEGHHYLTRVLRLAVGASVDLFDGRGVEVAATVAAATSRDVTLELGERRQVTRRPTPPVTLLQGLPRSERMDLVIQKATELGAARVVPVRTERSAPGQQARTQRWEKIAREAARQCGRPDLLEVAPLVGLSDALAGLPPGATRILPWEEASGGRPFGLALLAPPAAVAVLIGPEGGLTLDEVAMAKDAGFQVVTLGPRVLRTETAAIVALAIVQSLVGALD